MADAIVGLLVENLNSLIQREIGLLLGVDDDIRKLYSTLTTIQAVLEDAESKKIDNKPLENWLAKLKDASFEAADLLEEWANNAQQSTYNHEVVNSSLSCFCLKQLHFRSTIAKKTKMLIARFDDIARERSNFHLSENVVPTSLQLEESRETGSILKAEVVYGRDDDKKNVIETLCNNMGTGEDMLVLPIIGMGGLGKTTLAQWVYNDHRVISNFEERIWVCVSDNFEVKGIMKMMLESLDGKGCDLEHLDTIERQLQEKLREKKFLLVLDDVWNKDAEKWMKLKSVLKCGSQGSSILVTCREEGVASIMESVSSYTLKCLSEEECWILFKDCAFGQAEEEEVSDLVNIGKEIVKKCVGVPLAVKSLGGLMWSKTTVDEWEQVRDSKIWELQEEESGILPALKLSYKHLPPQLKGCFTFCSVYPKDYKMNREHLIQSWMANGYLQSNGRMEPEALGKLIFYELLHRGFFQEREIKMDDDSRETCKMHDLMHDLACSMSVNECSVVEVGREDATVKCSRHMSLVFDLEIGAESSNRCLSQVKSNSRLRTLILLGEFKSYIEPALILENLYSLRALELSELGLETLPNSIGKMKHLKYLNLARSRVELLPESICKLRNLKCLILRDCYSLQGLPKGTSKMRGLRRLDIEGCDKISEMPSGMEQLTQLQTLRGGFRVGTKSGGAGVINGLKGMQQLRGALWIRGLEHVRKAEADLVKGTQHLSLLRLKYWYRQDENDAAGELQEKVLEECLRPHPNLKELIIDGYRGANLPSWIGELQNVVKIDLCMCMSCERLPALGRLPLLKFLHIGNMNSLKCIDDDFYGEGVVIGGRASAASTSWFPSLQQLELSGMGSLEEWSLPSAAKEEEEESHHHHPRAGVFPCLKELTIIGCDKLQVIPCLPCVQNIKLDACNEMILRSISNLGPHSLLTLVIDSFQEMTHLPEGTFINSSSAALQSLVINECMKLKSLSGEIQNLTSLTSLKISYCDELDSLSELEGLLGKLTSLTRLSINECPSLERLPVMGIPGGFNNSLLELKIKSSGILTISEGLQYLTSLRILYIQFCPELELMSRDDQEDDGFRHLISLQSLTLHGLTELSALPVGMQHLVMLKSFKISECESLRMLPEWLQHLTSLQSLEVFLCENLRMLPESLQHLTSLQSLQLLECENLRMLPESLQNLTPLQSLVIENCHPDLHERCERDKGKDWHIISHIPHLRIQ